MSTAAHAIWVVMCTRAKWSTNARDFRGTRTWPCAWRLTRQEAMDLCERLTAHSRVQREAATRSIAWAEYVSTARSTDLAKYWPTFDVLRVTEEVDPAALDAFDRTEDGTGEVGASGVDGVAASPAAPVASSAQPDRERSATLETCECYDLGQNPPGKVMLVCPRHGTRRA